MFRRQDEVVRVGIGVVLAAALAGLLVLLFHGSASPSELTSAEQEEIDRAALMLLRRELRSADERVAEAESMLRRERDARLGELVSSIAETGWRGMTGASPTSLAKDGYRIARRAYSWLAPSRTEAEALALIEPEVDAGTHNERLLRLYERLRSRETAVRVSELVESAEDAISAGDAGGARRAIDRIERIQPDSDDLPELKSELDDLLQVAAESAVEEPIAPVRDWEAEMAAALLAEHYERVPALGPDAPDAELARGVAELLAGQNEGALDRLRDLTKSDAPAADAARRELASSDIAAEGRFVSAQRRYRIRRTLGWIGGEGLEDHGLDLSASSFRAWRKSLEPLNLAISAPLRMARRREANGDDLREAAATYLEVAPRGARAEAARYWLAALDPSAETERRSAVWDDARFVIPAARVSYESTVAGPILLAADVLERLALPDDLLADAREAEGLLLRPDPAVAGVARSDAGVARSDAGVARSDAGVAHLDSAEALALLATIYPEVEDGKIRADRSRIATLDALRRVERAVRRGSHLSVEVVSAPEPNDAALRRVRRALLGGARRQLGSLEDDQELRGEKALVARSTSCPARTLCLSKSHELDAVAWARIEGDGDAQLGARAQFEDAAVDVQLDTSGPRASLTIPVSRWLGFHRWVAVQAYVGVSLDGISFSPTFRRDDAPPERVLTRAPSAGF